MLAVDTNVIVRYLTNDHPSLSGAQTGGCAGRLGADDRAIGSRVGTAKRLSLYPDSDCSRIPKVRRPTAASFWKTLPSPLGRWIGSAWAWISDARHLGASDNCEAFATFDTDMIKPCKEGGRRNHASALASVCRRSPPCLTLVAAWIGSACGAWKRESGSIRTSV